MATSVKNNNNNGSSEEEGEEEATKQIAQTLKEGERLVGPTRRPDGTLRKAIRIRAGFVPQDEVPIYQSKGTLWRKEKESQLPPGYDPEIETKTKSKSLKRNERKKEKRQQAALDRAKNSEHLVGEYKEENDANNPNSKTLESVASQISQLDLSTTASANKSSTNPTEGSDICAGVDIDKKIRALKKKIRLAEAQLQKVSPEEMKPEQLEKAKKLEGWREELKLLEGAYEAEFSAS